MRPVLVLVLVLLEASSCSKEVVPLHSPQCCSGGFDKVTILHRPLRYNFLIVTYIVFNNWNCLQLDFNLDVFENKNRFGLIS